MGKGRGSVNKFVTRLRCGSIIYYLSQVDVAEGVSVLKKIQKYIGVTTNIFVRKLPSADIKGSVIRLFHTFLKWQLFLFILQLIFF